MQDFTMPFLAGGMRIALIVATLFLAFLPIIVALSKSRIVLRAAAILLSLIALGLGAWAMTSGMAFAIIMPFAGATWFTGLLCGLVAFSSWAAERQSREMAFRIIHGDPRHLPIPRSLKGSDKV